MMVSNQELTVESKGDVGEALLKAGETINAAKELNRDLSGLEPPVADVFFFIIIILTLAIGVALFYLIKETT